MQSPVSSLLKARTAATHERVESMLDLVGESLTAERLRAVLSRFAGFWVVSERGIDAWARANPEPAAALSWTRRCRSAVLRADLRELGLTEAEVAGLPEAAPIVSVVGHADVLGWLYVSEGSTLGGAVIDRVRRRHATAAIVAVRTFTPYPEGPGPMWRSYLDSLARWVGDDSERCEAVVTAAQRSFDGLADWLEPVAVKAAV